MGVVLVVPPWNFPYAIAAGGVLAALAAGNTVLLKPAPEAVRVGWILADQLWRSGVPRDVLQFVPSRDDDVGRHLVSHPGVDAVILTGSLSTAEMFRSWHPTMHLLAETSGKNSLVITAAADVDAAIKDLVRSAFGHAGQKCSAASVAIVEAPIYDDPAFQRQLADAVASLRVGPSWLATTAVGPVIRPPDGALLRALTQLDEGETWLVEPRVDPLNPRLWSPGVKVGVRPGSWSHRTEWFGPVLAVMRAPDFITALTWQNATDFGLTAGLHSLDPEECTMFTERVEAGNVYINRATTGAIVQRQPFGGWKRSAIGPGAKAGGPGYVAVLQQWRTTTGPDIVERARRSYVATSSYSRAHDPKQPRSGAQRPALPFAAPWGRRPRRRHDHGRADRDGPPGRCHHRDIDAIQQWNATRRGRGDRRIRRRFGCATLGRATRSPPPAEYRSRRRQGSATGRVRRRDHRRHCRACRRRPHRAAAVVARAGDLDHRPPVRIVQRRADARLVTRMGHAA